LLAEKNNPQADVVWGLAGTSLLLLKSEGMLESYAPAGVEKLDSKFVDGDNPPAWVGMDAWVAAVCYNTVEAAKAGLTPPTSWKDLTGCSVRRTFDYAKSKFIWYRVSGCI
jgi:iron(III) transport system substrate-binding protein